MKRKSRKAREAAELRTLGRRIRPQATGKKKKAKKNLFGFGRGESRESVEGARKREAKKLFERGEYRQARKTARMSTRRYARKKGIRLEGRLRTKLRGAKERARGRVHGVVDRIFGANSKRNGLGTALVEGVGIGLGIMGAEKAVKSLTKRNPLPALLSSLGGALEEGAGFAAGEKLLSDVTRRKKVAKKKKKSRKAGKRPRLRKTKARRTKRPGSKTNPRKRPARVTHAVAVGNRIVSYGTKRQVEHDAKILRKAGKKVRIGRRA